jgi:hypothetical protein
MTLFALGLFLQSTIWTTLPLQEGRKIRSGAENFFGVGPYRVFAPPRNLLDALQIRAISSTRMPARKTRKGKRIPK